MVPRITNDEKSSQSVALSGISLRTRIVAMFGGIGWMFGSIFLTVGLILMTFMAPKIDYFGWLVFMWGTETKEGTLISAEETGNSENEQSTYRYTYTYEIDGTSYQGESYGTMVFDSDNRPVQIEYLTDDPGESRIVDTRQKPMPVWLVFFYLFPLIGFLFSWGSWIQGRERASALCNSRMVPCRYVPESERDQDPSSESGTDADDGDGVPFEFTDHRGATHRFLHETSEPELFDEESEALYAIYNEAKPEEAILLDEFCQQLGVSASGRVHDVSFTKALVALVWPSLIILGAVISISLLT